MSSAIYELTLEVDVFVERKEPMKKYKKYNIDATEENIKKTIMENKYDRAKSIKSFIEGLDLIEDNAFISLDAKWGQGKTFYIRQIEMTLKYLSRKSAGQDISDLEEVFSGSILENMSLEKTYLPIYYNSWLYDNHNDPLMSLIYVIVKECEKHVETTINSKSLGDKLGTLLSSFSLSFPKLQISGDAEKIKESLMGRDLLKEIKTAEEIRGLVKEIFDSVIVESAQKLVIFIDELDRCKPSYAIELLERIKHYFDDERIVFVVAVNKEQLVHTISSYYGDAFDSTGYLNKFFDINIYLPEIPRYINNSIFVTNDRQYWVRRIVEELIEYYNLSLRDTILFLQDMEATSKEYYSDSTRNGCVLSFFVPVILILERVNQALKKDFLEGRGKVFDELCKNVPSIYELLLKFGNRERNENERYSQGFNCFLRIYEGTFKGNLSSEETSIEQYRLKELCMRVCNGER